MLTLVPSYATMVSGLNVSRKGRQDATHHFEAIAIETTEVFGSEASYSLHELGVRLKTESGDPRAYHFLLQRHM